MKKRNTRNTIITYLRKSFLLVLISAVLFSGNVFASDSEEGFFEKLLREDGPDPTGEPEISFTEAARKAAEEGKGPLKIGILLWKSSDSYGRAVRDSMVKYAGDFEKETGLKIRFDIRDAGGNLSVQETQAESMFSSENDIIIINLADTAGGEYLEELAIESGIPTVFYNREPLDTRVITDIRSVYIGTNPEEAGIRQAEDFDKLFREEPEEIDRNGDGKINYLLFEGEIDNPEAIARTEYCIRTLLELDYELEALAETQVAGWNRKRARKMMADQLEIYNAEEIEAVFCNNDDMALGVIDALMDAGWNLPDSGADHTVCVLGIDATDEALELIKTGQLAGTVKQDNETMGKAVMEIALNKILTGYYIKGTDYVLSDDTYSVRIPYRKITIFPD